MPRHFLCYSTSFHSSSDTCPNDVCIAVKPYFLESHCFTIPDLKNEDSKQFGLWLLLFYISSPGKSLKNLHFVCWFCFCFCVFFYIFKSLCYGSFVEFYPLYAFLSFWKKLISVLNDALGSECRNGRVGCLFLRKKYVYKFLWVKMRHCPGWFVPPCVYHFFFFWILGPVHDGILISFPCYFDW